MRAWTTKEEQLLSKLYGKNSLSLIAQKLGRTEAAISHKVRRLKLAHKDLGGLVSIDALADHMGVSIKTARRRVHVHGAHRVRRGKSLFYDMKGEL